ncbi:hypothetical protein NKH77_06745 [Streptomyces sp. M19]
MTRPDGTRQLAIKCWPVYRFTGDARLATPTGRERWASGSPSPRTAAGRASSAPTRDAVRSPGSPRRPYGRSMCRTPHVAGPPWSSARRCC